MQGDIEFEAKKLVKKLINTTTAYGHIPALLIYTYKNSKDKNALYCKNDQIIQLLVNKKVIRVINRIKKNKVTIKYKVSPRRNFAEDFLNIIQLEDFSWNKKTGIWIYKKNSRRFKTSGGSYRLVDLFMSNPNQKIDSTKIIATYYDGKTGSQPFDKTKVNNAIRDIKKNLEIPKKHFVPTGKGYIFSP